MNPLENDIEIRFFQAALPAGGVRHDRLPIGDQLFAREESQIVLRNVVAQSVEELGRNDFSGSRHLRILGWIELDEVNVATSVADPEAGCNTLGLCADDSPGTLHRRTVAAVGTSDQLLHAHPTKRVPILKPAAVRNLAQRIDVHRALWNSISRLAESVDHEVVLVIQLVLRNVLNIDGGIVVYPDR